MRLEAEGVVVAEPDDLDRLHLQTDLDEDGVRAALRSTGTGRLLDPDTALLDLAVLRSRATLLATAPGWTQRWTAMTETAARKGRLSDDGRAVQVHIER